MKRILLSLFITSAFATVHADEGMWMLTDLQKQNEVAMTELGLLIPTNQIYNPDGIALKDAVVHFGENLCLCKDNAGIGSKEYKGAVFKAGKVDFFPVLNYSVLALPYFQSRKKHSRNRNRNSLYGFK